MPSLKDSLIVIVASLLLGLVGALPMGIFALIFGSTQIALNLYLLATVFLASWFPLKMLIDSQVKGQVNFKLPQFTLNRLSLNILILAAIPAIFFLYYNTFLPFLLATLFYRFSEGAILLAAILGMGLQVAYIYRGSQREKAMGMNSNVFVRVQDFGQASFNIELDPSQVTRHTPREDEPQVIYLPEQNLQDRSQETGSDAPPMTITLDPDSLSEQSDDET